MKRTALILLTTVYLLSIADIGVSRFYCCGKLTSVTLTYASADHTDKGNCCKHEKQSFKVKDNHINVASFTFTQLFPVILPASNNWVAVSIENIENTHTLYRSNAPPDNPGIPLYTINCTYRI